MNYRTEMAKALHHPLISDSLRLKQLGLVFNWVDQNINDRAELKTQVEFWAEDGQVLVIRDSTDCDGTFGRYLHLMPADWRQVQDYIHRCLDDAEGPEHFQIRSPRRYDIYANH
jgi:hypothetical protein